MPCSGTPSSNWPCTTDRAVTARSVRLVVGRAGVGAVILATHIGLAVLLATRGAIKTPTLVPSVAISSLQQDPRPLERASFDKPILTPIHPMLVPPPEVVAAVEPD